MHKMWCTDTRCQQGPFWLHGLDVKGGLVRDGGWTAGNLHLLPSLASWGWGWVGITSLCSTDYWGLASTSGGRGLGWAWPTASIRRQSWEPLQYQGPREGWPTQLQATALPWDTAYTALLSCLLPLVFMWARRNFNLFIKVVVDFMYINIRQHHCHRTADFFLPGLALTEIPVYWQEKFHWTFPPLFLLSIHPILTFHQLYLSFCFYTEFL